MQIMDKDNGRILSERVGTENSQEIGKDTTNDDDRSTNNSANNVITGTLLNDMVNDTSNLDGDSRYKQTRRNVREVLVPNYLEVRPGVFIQSCGDIGTSCIEIK
jgi:hypothetical protein